MSPGNSQHRGHPQAGHFGWREVPFCAGVLSTRQLASRGKPTHDSDPSLASGHMDLALRPLWLLGLSVFKGIPGWPVEEESPSSDKCPDRMPDR